LNTSGIFAGVIPDIGSPISLITDLHRQDTGMCGIVREAGSMRRLEELKSSILLTENSSVEEADALQSDVELLTIEERQELLQHMRKLMMEARRLVVNLSRNYNTQFSEGEFGVNEFTVDEMLDIEKECWVKLRAIKRLQRRWLSWAVAAGHRKA
jgi:hypothetical protein